MSTHQSTDRRTSRIILVLGVLNILYGIGAILIRALLLFLLHVSPRPVSFHMSSSRIILMICGFILQVFLIAGGVGLLRGMPWGRSLSVFAAVTQIFFTITVYMHVILSVAMGQVEGSQPWLGVLIGGVLHLIYIIYPILLIILLSRESTRARFKPQRESISSEPH